MKYSLQQLTSKASVLSILLLNGVQPANGHYGFPIFLANGVASDWFQYIRPVGVEGSYQAYFSPIVDWIGEPQVCGINATNTGHLTSTIKLEPGSQIGFRVIPATYQPGVITPRPWDPENDFINHSGPGAAYMSKAPGELEDYKGDGDWFKIGVSGASDGRHWDSEHAHELNFTIPKTTPPGKYLVRVEHLNISPYYNMTQQFINCAQIEVTGSGGGSPGPMIKFPGAYDIEDPGIWIPTLLYNPATPQDLLKNWKGAGPEVWKG